MKNKTRERICLGAVTIAMALGTWITCKVLFSDQWLYDHTTLICSVAGIAIALVATGIVVMWKHTIMTTAVVAATIATVATTASAGDKDKSSGITTGQTNPYGNASVARPTWPYGWLFYGWGSVWDFLRDGLDSWQSGHPVITIDPQPPASDDTSGK